MIYDICRLAFITDPPILLSKALQLRLDKTALLRTQLTYERLCYFQVNIRMELGELFLEKMSDSKYQWMRDRITRLWPDWKQAAKALEAQNPTFRNRQHKNVS